MKALVRFDARSRRWPMNEIPERAPRAGCATVATRKTTLGGLLRPRSTRARVLVWLLLGLAVVELGSWQAVRELAEPDAGRRVDAALTQEVAEFRGLAGRGRDPISGRPLRNDLRTLFDVFARLDPPERGEALFTYVAGAPYRSRAGSPRAALLRPPAGVVRTLATTKRGWLETAAGRGRYLAAPVRQRGEAGVVIVAKFIAGERADIADTLRTEALVSLGGLVLVSMFAWIVAGRVLAPLQALSGTARTVTATDLTSRIPVEGHDELADLARTFNDMLDRLQRTLESQKEFIDDASHELLTPLTIIRGHLELRWEDPAEREATIELVTDEVMRMTRLVDELRVLALTRRPDFLDSEPLDAGAVVREVFDKVRLLATRDWQLEGGDGGRLVGDRQRLEQALINLAHNAVQYTGPEDRIVIGAAVDAGGARLWVADTGPGVPEDEHARIFERLAYGAGGRRHPNSTGLGLAIVSAIARAHGGRVELNSTPGDGATFAIVIPAITQQGEENDSGLIREALPAAVGG
jgi:two-component system, OmpR family, sensor kinase